MNENLKTINAFGEEVKINEDSFDFVQLDQKIHDQKFDTKPTTFFKDAMKRFGKNHSSVVGAIIIAFIIICTIFVPMILPYDVEGVHPEEQLVLPKLFESGTGFWDGTTKYKGQPFSDKHESGINTDTFNINAVSNIEYYEVEGVKYVNFVYDVYEAKYGLTTGIIVKTEMEEYVNNGWCEFEVNSDGTFNFKVLNEEKCPITKVISVDGDNYTCEYHNYKKLGYDHVPRYLFGTDNEGKDIFKLSFVGLRYSLVFAFLITTICFVFGLIWGSISGYFGGNVDLFLERFKEILGGVPLIVIVTLMQLHLNDKLPQLLVFAMALCITGWMGTAARTRTQFYRFKGREYVLASRTLGASDNRLIFKHILPNAMGTIITSSVLMVPSIIFTESSLSFLGLGLNGSNSFGNILSENQQFLQSRPMLVVFPAIVISLLMISFNLFGNGLRDAFNPSLKGSE